LRSSVRVLSLEAVDGFDRVAAVATVAIPVDGGELVLRGVAVRWAGSTVRISLPNYKCPARRAPVKVYEPPDKLRGEIEAAVLDRWNNARDAGSRKAGPASEQSCASNDASSPSLQGL